MDMDQAAVFLAGSILTMLGFVVVVAGIITVNNLLHKFWKPVKLIKWDHPPSRFLTEQDIQDLHKVPPTFDDNKIEQKKS
jgi:flagellar biogenesis protein FliO